MKKLREMVEVSQVPEMNPNGWNEWSRYVLKELERLNACYEKMDKRLREVQSDITMLKVKSGAWGALGGVLAAIGIYLARVVGK